MCCQRLTRILVLLFGLGATAALTACAAVGVAAHMAPPATILPAYNGFAGQSVGVMVWADRGIRIDFASIQVDLASAIHKRLEEAAPKTKQLKGTTFPVQAASIVRYQQDHPESEGAPIISIAPKLGVNRLIYIELESFTTRSDLTVDLFRGSASASVKVIEVKGSQAAIGYNESGIKVSFPPKVPREGIPNAGDAKMYTGTLDALATEITNRFLPHEEEEE